MNIEQIKKMLGLKSDIQKDTNETSVSQESAKESEDPPYISENTIYKIYNPTATTVTFPPQVANTSWIGGNNTTANITSAVGNPTTYVVGPSMNIPSSFGLPGSFTYGYSKPNNIISLSDYFGKLIVTLNNDGSVTWAQGIEIDEAADAFARSLTLSSEQVSGISKSVKARMRDTIFEELIDIAKEKGSLNSDDLTYLLKAAKIMEKLKGDRE